MQRPRGSAEWSDHVEKTVKDDVILLQDTLGM